MVSVSYIIRCIRSVVFWTGAILLFLAGNAQAQCTYLQNTDFEDTQISTTQTIGPESLIAPWHTTASDKQVEIWRSGFLGVPSYSGNQFIELNANLVSIIFQNFTATPGQTFTLNFAHRGRSGNDVMKVSIGSPIPVTATSGTSPVGTTYVDLGNFTDGNNAWGYYSATFTIPLSATGTSFSVRFISVSAAGGSPSVGNFLDAISIGDVAPALPSQSLTIVCPATTTNLTSLTATNTPTNTIQSWHTGPLATSANVVNTPTAVGAGTYYASFYNTTRQCYGATTVVTVTGPTGLPATPAVTVVQPVCAGGSITVTSPLGTGLTYSIDGTTYSSSPAFTGVAPGVYSVTVRNASTCISSPTSVTINPGASAPAAPTASVTVQPSCTLATGTITVTSPTGTGLTYSIDGTNYVSSTTFTGVAPGTYSVRVRNAAGCTSNPTSVTVNAQPPTPVAPTVSVTQQPSCTLATGTITISAPTGTGLTYSIDGSTYTNTTGTFSGVSPGTYSVTVRNSSGCTSAPTSVTVNAQPATPSAPTLTVTQPTCVLATGTITVTSPTGTGLTYSIDGSIYTNTTGTFSGVAPGVYSVTVRNTAGCTSNPTSVTVNAQPPTPVAPTATVTQQPNCTLATGTITVSAPTGSGLTYSLNGSTYTNTTGIFTGVAPGVYPITVRNSNGCTSATTSVTVTAQPPTPAAPTVTVTQPTCTLATSTITVTSPTGTGLTYSIDGSIYTNTTGIFSGVSPGIYSVTVRNSSGCTSAPTSVTVNAQPPTPVAPTATVTQQPNCTLATGTITVSAPTGTGLTYSIDGSTYTNTTGVFTGVSPGAYAVTVRNSNGCTSNANSVTVTAQPATPTLTLNSATVCAGNTVTLTVSGCTGGTLRWSTGDNTTSLVVVPLLTTIYSATCTGASGCSATVSATVTVRPTPTYTDIPTVTPATCTGTIANPNARISLTGLQNTERADISTGSTYTGPAYGAVSNQLVSGNAVNFTNLPNPSSPQSYTIRLFSAQGTCTTDVVVLLSPADCRCPTPGCPRVTIRPPR